MHIFLKQCRKTHASLLKTAGLRCLHKTKHYIRHNGELRSYLRRITSSSRAWELAMLDIFRFRLSMCRLYHHDMPPLHRRFTRNS